MRAVIQCVSTCTVEVEGEIVGSIAEGLCVLLGITQEDSEEDINWIIRKILNLRIFNDREGKMNLSVKDIQGELLVISQFTLYASTKKGNRPSYIRSAKPEVSLPIYNKFLDVLKESFDGKVESGTFGAMMSVSLVNEGPVTIIIDSKQPNF
ncbi:MAG: D-aminoacyl-tRNA deacylase [Bacteroidota bacterium]